MSSFFTTDAQKQGIETVKPIGRLDHVLIVAQEASSVLRFFSEIVGLHIGERPPFRFSGWWLYLGDQAVIHLVESRSPDARLAGTGMVDHVAFRLTDYDAVKARIIASGQSFSEAIVPFSGERQLFVEAPGGLLVELVFS